MRQISFRDDILPLKDKLFRLALRITLDRAEAEDVVQDTLLKVWSRRNEWTQLESVEAYCLTLAKNLAIDRSRGAETRHVELTAASPFDHLVNKERMTLVGQLVNELPEKQRIVLQLRDIEGESYRKIATVLHLTEEQVKVTLFRARQKVKQRFLEIEKYGL